MSYHGLGTLGDTPSITSSPKAWAVAQAQNYYRLRSSRATHLNPTDYLKRQIEDSDRPSLSWAVLYPGFASELSRLKESTVRVNVPTSPSLGIRSTGKSDSGGASQEAIEAVALAARSMAKSYGEAMRQNAKTLRAAGFGDEVVKKAFSDMPRSMKIYLAAARFIKCGGSKAEALSKASRQMSDPNSRAMYYSAYMKCKDSPSRATSTSTTPSEISPTVPDLPDLPDLPEESTPIWKYAAIGAGALAVVGIGVAILK